MGLAIRNVIRTALLNLAIAVFTLTLISTTAQAQIEEVVVTAERRAESIQDVPIAITAFSEDGIEKMRIQDFNDLGKKKRLGAGKPDNYALREKYGGFCKITAAAILTVITLLLTG